MADDLKTTALVINININTPAAGPTVTYDHGTPATVDVNASNSPAWNPNSHDIGGQWAGVRAAQNTLAVRAQLRTIYNNLFTNNFTPASDTAPFPEVQMLQAKLISIDPANPNKALTIADGFADRMNNPVTGKTVVDALNEWLAPLNGNANAPFSHSQYVLLWHIFRDQEDLKLLAPWEVGTPANPIRPW